MRRGRILNAEPVGVCHTLGEKARTKCPTGTRNSSDGPTARCNAAAATGRKSRPSNWRKEQYENATLRAEVARLTAVAAGDGPPDRAS